MTVRSTNSAPRGTVSLPVAAQKQPAPALAQPQGEPKKSSGRQDVHSSFEGSGQLGATGSKQGSKDIGDLWAPPSLPKKGSVTSVANVAISNNSSRLTQLEQKMLESGRKLSHLTPAMARRLVDLFEHAKK